MDRTAWHLRPGISQKVFIVRLAPLTARPHALITAVSYQAAQMVKTIETRKARVTIYILMERALSKRVVIQRNTLMFEP